MRANKIRITLAWVAAFACAPACAAEPELASTIEQALGAYEGVQNYYATFEKRERDGAALGETEKIFFKFEKPFKIFMHWTNSDKKGLQLVYERGKNKNKLAIHKPGLGLGLVPVVFLDQSSPWVREGSESFDIEDAGIGTFLHDFAKVVTRAEREGKLKVLDRRVEGSQQVFNVEFPGSTEDGDYFAERVVAGFDMENRLPVRMELYGWDGKPIGVYEYKDLRLNLGDGDGDFRKRINRHLLRVYDRPPAEAIPAKRAKNNFSG